MKTIKYDHEHYEVINTIESEHGLFQKVKFPTGNYGVVYVIPEHNIYDVILVGTDDDDTYVNVFMEFARNQTDVINQIHEEIDEVKLVVLLDEERSEVFEELVSKDEANDLIERLKITNEIISMKQDEDYAGKWLPVLCVANFVCMVWWLVKCILT